MIARKVRKHGRSFARSQGTANTFATSSQELSESMRELVWNKVFPTSDHEIILWRLLGEDDGFNAEASTEASRASHDTVKRLSGRMIEFGDNDIDMVKKAFDVPLVEWSESSGVTRNNESHHSDAGLSASNAYGSEHSVFQSMDTASLVNVQIARVLAYDVVKFMPYIKEEAWKRVLEAVNVDLTRADHTDHTIAALDVLNAIPGSLLLQFCKYPGY